MTDFLNSEIYRRFGMEVNLDRVFAGFKHEMKEQIKGLVYPLFHYNTYGDDWPQRLSDDLEKFMPLVERNFLVSRAAFFSDFAAKYQEDEFASYIVSGNLPNVIANIQILINIVPKFETISDELEELVSCIESFAKDYPIIGLLIKRYKKKAPQIFPSTSKRQAKELIETLDVLDDERFSGALEHFELAIRHFGNAKTIADFRTIVSDLHTACDEAVKVTLNNSGKSFRNAYDKDDYKKLGLNGEQKEIFKHLKAFMDTIKHASKNDINRDDIEMIISMVGSFIRLVIRKS